MQGGNISKQIIMVKTYHLVILLSLLVSFGFVSCTKNKVSDVDFSVSTAAATFKLSDTVVFNLSGNPDVIAFYSGDSTNDYELRNQTSKAGGVLKMSFQFRAANDSGFAALNSGALKILVSTSFPGTYYAITNVVPTAADTLMAGSADSALANATKWTDITNRFGLPTSGTANTFYNTSVADLSDIITSASSPFNIAIKYAADTTHSLGTNGITIGGLLLSSSFPDGTVTNFNLVPGGAVSKTWKIIKAANAINSWATSSTQLKFTSKYTTKYSEDWVISNAFYPNVAAPDIAIPIKNISQAPLTKYAYQFKKLGAHKVVFVASNNRDYGQSQVVREINLNIVP